MLSISIKTSLYEKKSYYPVYVFTKKKVIELCCKVIYYKRNNRDVVAHPGRRDISCGIYYTPAAFD